MPTRGWLDRLTARTKALEGDRPPPDGDDWSEASGIVDRLTRGEQDELGEILLAFDADLDPGIVSAMVTRLNSRIEMRLAQKRLAGGPNQGIE